MGTPIPPAAALKRRPPRGRRVQAVLALAAVLSLGPAAAHAQVRSAASDVGQPPTAVGAVVGGALGAGIGVVGGALVGVAMACGSDCYELEGLAGAAFGAIIGETLLLPLGVHVGNGRHGRLERNLLASVGTGLATLLLASATGSEEILVLGMGAQVALTVVAERTAGRRHLPPRSLEVTMTPVGPAAIGVGVTLRF